MLDTLAPQFNLFEAQDLTAFIQKHDLKQEYKIRKKIKDYKYTFEK